MKVDLMIKSRVQDDDAALVTALFEQYHGDIFAYLYRLLNDREGAHDLTQDVFMQVFRHRHKLPDIENERAWIYRIASNMAFNALKRQRRFAWLPWQQNEELPLVELDLEKQVDTQTAVLQALTKLSMKYRAPLLLYSHYDFTVREIATVLNISEGAVKNRLWRAREMFRNAYEENNA